ncbi:MAG: amidohydrolase family protein [Acidobacteria bacterium]|nr:amidohydrolase family protein [Acidobacteriota bacterium]
MKKLALKKIVCSAAISVFLFLFVLSVRSQGQSGDTMVIEGGTLIDGNGGAPVRDALIIIRGNRIETVSRKGQVAYPAGARVLQADGKFILPGLMDAHTHYQGWMAELMPAYGVTSVFQIGGGGEWGLAQRKAIAHGKVPGPRNFLAVGSIAGSRIAALAGRVGTEGPLSGRQVVGTAAQAREVVRRFIDNGADMIKVHRGPPIEVYRAAIEEAHKVGLPVVAQPIGPTVYAKEAVLAGADILEHAAGVGYSIVKDPSKWEGFGTTIEVHSIDPTPFADMDDGKAAELIQLMVERNVYLEPDFIAVGRGFQKNRLQFESQDYRLLADPGLAYVSRSRRLKELAVFKEFDEMEPAEWERRHQGYLNMLRFMKMFVDAGGKVMTGTDTSSWAVPGLGLHHEMQILVEEVGMTPMQTILAATRNPAEGFRILDRLGTIETGKLADLLIVNEDPLQDINNLQKIEWVIQDGKLLDRTFHPWFRNPLSSGATVEARAWVAALKRQTIQRDPTWAFGQPPPGIESISPIQATEGDPALTMTIGGVNFTSKSVAYFDGQPVPTKLVNGSELQITVAAALIARAGNYPITVKNPEPLQRREWGDGTSNRAHLLVDFKY